MLTITSLSAKLQRRNVTISGSIDWDGYILLIKKSNPIKKGVKLVKLSYNPTDVVLWKPLVTKVSSVVCRCYKYIIKC